MKRSKAVSKAVVPKTDVVPKIELPVTPKKVLSAPIMNDLTRLWAEVDRYDYFLESNKRGAWKGDIVGSNKIDVAASLEELFTNYKKTAEGGYVVEYGEGSKLELSAADIKLTQESIKKWGNCLYMILYERPKGFSIPLIYPNKEEYLLVAYSDQVDGWDSDDEILSVRSAGSNRYGRFEYPTGYPERVPFLVSEIRTMAWVEANRQLVSNIGNIVEDSISVNPILTQLLGYKRMEQPIKVQRQKEDGT